MTKLIFLSIIIVMIIWIIACVIRKKKYKKIEKIYPNKSISDFWLSESEQKKWLKTRNIFWGSKTKIDELVKISYNENLSRNKDGTISIRSNRGKEINGLLRENIKTKNTYFTILENFKFIPIRKYENVKYVFSLYNSSKYSFLFYTICLYYSFKHFFKSPILFLTEIYEMYFLNKKEYFLTLNKNWEKNLLIAFVISTLVSVVVFYICHYIIFKFIFAKRYSRPPEVIYSNYNIY
jgi:hypothetical protein